MSQIQVRDPNGAPAANINLRIALGNADSDSAIFDIQTDEQGNQGWPIPFWPTTQSYIIHANFRRVNPAFGTASVPVPKGYGGDVAITLERSQNQPAPSGIGRLHRDGNDLKNDAGQIVRLEAATFFPAHWLLLERGADAIKPSLRELRDRYQVNCLVVFGMSVNVQRNLFNADPFDPSRYGQGFFDTFLELFDIFASEGCYGYYPVFPDHGLEPAFDSDGKCVDHWNRLMPVARKVPNLLLKPTNEGASKGYNYINPHLLDFPDFCPVAACDYGVDDPAYASGDWPDGYDWGGDRTFGDLHPPRSGAATILDCTAVNNIYYKHNRGLAISEPIRMGSNGSGGVTREIARLVGLASRVGTLMRCFHSLQGEKCETFDDVTRDHADAFFTGV